MAAPFPEIYDATDSATISSPITASINAGNSLAAVEYRVWNDKGATHSSTRLTNAYLRVVAYDGTNKVTSGLPALEEGWLKARLIGQNKTGDSSMSDQTSAWIPLGAERALILADIPANCARHIEVRFDVPAGAANNAQEIYLELVYAETTIVLGRYVSLASGNVVIRDWYDASLRRFTSGRGITATGTDVVTVARGGYVHEGLPYYGRQTAVTLNQTSASGALAAGESYIAALSQAENIAAATTTKGNRAVTPSAPATPTDEILIGYATVTYQAGGTSVINQGNVDQTALVYGEFYLYAGAGLNLNIGAGTAITSSDTSPFQTNSASIVLVNGTNYVWLLGDGTFTSSIATSAAPAADAVALGVVVAAAGVITTIFQGPAANSVYGGRAVDRYVMALRYPGPLSAVTNADWNALPGGAWILESWRAVVLANAASAQDTIIDVNYGDASSGIPTTSIFTSQGSDDQRIRIVQASGILTVTGASHDRQALSINATWRDHLFGIDIDQANPNASDLLVQLLFRRL